MRKSEERKEYLKEEPQRGTVTGWKQSRGIVGEVHPGADTVKESSRIRRQALRAESGRRIRKIRLQKEWNHG